MDTPDIAIAVFLIIASVLSVERGLLIPAYAIGLTFGFHLATIFVKSSVEANE